MESKKPKINSKITLYKSIKFITWIALGFVIGSILRYSSTIFFGVPIRRFFFEDAEVFLPIFYKDVVTFFTYFLKFGVILSVIAFFLWSGEFFIKSSIYKKKSLYIIFAVVIGVLNGCTTGFALVYDSTIASATDAGAIVIGPLFMGIFGAFVLAFINGILAGIFIHKKNFLNLAFALLIGLSIGLNIGHLLVFLILSLV